ncbi:3-hydroxy-3-methylglutaryl coenzyme A reductase [Companilactobacillus crustorum]|uniref:3-hydroxy-3-methylglutaryl coenzyme A reductase n=3 Tax=Companilactobacillus TaxID=2767879 RepID=A0A837RH57_9LACO|nr:hydroxymethylglutaryl-CoA reductase, degradative [Companilactobacillus crustorum]HCD06996.1 hydroxymethylglutaryl-CoA reductase, degradative [Lactobacillus sp.]APU71987.1 3-hydroxy-3-methylglutaryl-coenzyme A reductase [Companilactobacillus crustorum]KRK42512.1 HMG-CoA reductase [Companilactobacillus crustorum JCM 15951]KRO20362.1 HMG-CoA reductase [Companilactobacillus crustorum]WDT65937.1 hydroxymethylglutaryl-CoA reductase, degradative [Companilactobacillus crustorum]
MKIYEMTDEQRRKLLVDGGYITKQQAKLLEDRATISTDLADSLSENQIGSFSLPYGFATDFLIDDQEYLVPMVIEEPSVVAAASNAAKRIKNSGGFKTFPTARIVYGQIVLEKVTKSEVDELERHNAEIFEFAQEAHPSLIKRGGGIVSLKFNRYDDYLEVELGINTVDAMGANLVNTILEKTAQKISTMVSSKILCSILSNSGQGQIITVEAVVDFEQLSTKSMTGSEVAQKIVQLANFAKVSVKRAVTHNKGIMNGIDAVLLATGNDFRAQEAAAHSYALESGQYQPFTVWKVSGTKLIGTLKMPIELGSVGGAIRALPMAQLSLAIMKIKDSKQLQSVVGAVGLANNLSALRALVTTGIQAGHMSLQSKSLAVSAGAVGTEIDQVSAKLNQTKDYTIKNAQNILLELRNK